MNPLAALDLPSVEADLARLEPLLSTSVETGEQFLDEVTTHLIKAGGKRLRPLLGVAAATAGERDATMEDLMGAVSVELVHLASLYHDDVMDEAEIRRNVDSVNARYGNLVAIVAGDYLLARSAAIAADLGTEIASVFALVARHHVDDLLANCSQVATEGDQHLCGNAFAFTDEAEQHVLRADVAVAELQCFAKRQLEHLLCPRGEWWRATWWVARHANGLFDLLAHSFQGDAEGL